MMAKGSWGGRREGAGPPTRYRTPRRMLAIRLTDEEWADLLARLPRNTRKRGLLLLGLAPDLEAVEVPCPMCGRSENECPCYE